MQLTFRYRVKEKHAAQLAAQAAAVNYVWNFCNETQMRAAKSGRKWLGYRDLDRLTKGATRRASICTHRRCRKSANSTIHLAGSIASRG
jgi:putative transposase